MSASDKYPEIRAWQAELIAADPTWSDWTPDTWFAWSHADATENRNERVGYTFKHILADFGVERGGTILEALRDSDVVNDRWIYAALTDVASDLPGIDITADDEATELARLVQAGTIALVEVEKITARSKTTAPIWTFNVPYDPTLSIWKFIEANP